MKPATNDRIATLQALCCQYRLELLYVFGSRALDVWAWLHGDVDILAAGPSDVDVGVKPAMADRFGVDEKVRLAQALEDFFGVTRVDVVALPEADPFLAANIIRGERLFAADPYLADEYDLYVLRRAGDCIPLERQRMELILRGARHVPH
jgi:hypothetical protein